MFPINRRIMIEVLSETLADHGVDDELIQDALPDIMERLEIEFEFEFTNDTLEEDDTDKDENEDLFEPLPDEDGEED